FGEEKVEAGLRMRSLGWRLLAVLLAVLAVSTAIGLYVYHYLHAPKAVSTRTTGPARASLTLGTTPAAGSLGGSKSWVSYLVRQRQGARDDEVHVPHRQAGPFPLAVLRPLRRRLHRRVRGTDADDRLHGRLPARGLSPSDHARAVTPAPHPDHLDRGERHPDADHHPGRRPGAASGRLEQSSFGPGRR